MGLARAAVNLLLNEASRRPFSGTIATLGRQHVYVTDADLRRLATERGVRLADFQGTLHREPTLAARGFLSDDSLFAALGFSGVVRIDYSDYESADEILDLNTSAASERLRNRFDVILDSGTMEHVFHVPHLLGHLHRMLKVGGRIIHLSPASNCVEHGFYSFSPTFFSDYYAANRYETNTIYLCRCPRRFERGRWDVYDYGRGREFLPMGRLDDRVYYVFAVVTSRGDSTAGAIPQQSVYASTWTDAAQGRLQRPWYEREPADSKGGKLLRLAGRYPALLPAARKALRIWRSGVQSLRAVRHRIPYPGVGRF